MLLKIKDSGNVRELLRSAAGTLPGNCSITTDRESEGDSPGKRRVIFPSTNPPAGRKWNMTIAHRSRRLTCSRLTALVFGILLLSFTARAQHQTPAATNDPGNTPSAQQQQDERETGTDDQIAPKNDRLFGVIPNYTTVESQDPFSPVSVKGKFKLAVDSSFDPYTFPFIGFVALIGQAENSEPSYGQGFEGYGKRYGTAYGDAIIGTFMTTSVFPSLLHQDPRYYQLGEGS